MSVLKNKMARRLLLAVRWVTADELADGLSTCPAAIEDALADLVLEGCAEYKPRVGYRAAASDTCRDALRQLMLGKHARHVVGRPFENVLRLAVAERRAGLGVVSYELELPLPGDLNDYPKLMNDIAKGRMHV